MAVFCYNKVIEAGVSLSKKPTELLPLGVRVASASLATIRLERERELYNTLSQGTSDPWLLSGEQIR